MVKSIQRLKVALNGIHIANLEKLKSGVLKFYYLPTWLDRPDARPISLSMPLRTQSFEGDIVLNYFDNLLPDNEIIRTRIQTRFNVKTKHPFDLLSTIGRDCVGAVQLFLEDITPPDIKKIKATPIDEIEISEILLAYKTAPLGMPDSEEDFRISIAGAQEKTALLHLNNQWLRPHESTPTNTILKLPIGYLQHSQIDLSESCENEWLCAVIAKLYGLPVANAKICHFNHIKVLCVERFDRRMASDNSWIIRLPQEDMCQTLGTSPALKYESDGGPGICDIMNVLLGSQNAIQDREIFFKSQIIFWLLAAIDGHAKNFSIFIEPGGAYRLTPLYDILSAFPYMNPQNLPRQKVKMAMSLIGKNRQYQWDRIQPRHFISTAKACNFSTERAQAMLTEIAERTPDVIQEARKLLPSDFPKHTADSILKGLEQSAKRL